MAGLMLFIAAATAADPGAAIRAALDRGDLASAEQKLHAELKAQPNHADLPALAERLGLAFAKAGQFDKAEAHLSVALAASPSNFKLLYNTGVFASYAGHHKRAREVLTAALRQQPQNVDALYSLAYVHQQLKEWESVVRLLVQAAQIAPSRADIHKLMAIATTGLRAYDDALAAWNRYIQLAPSDELARRERGAAAVRIGQFAQGIDDLEWFLRRHPKDAIGHYELALAKAQNSPAEGLAHLNTAIELKPDLAPARGARGSLYYQQGNLTGALADFEYAARLQPENAAILDRLGQTYSALDRPIDAVRVLRRAAALAPDDSKTQLHLARALADAGEATESEAVMDRFRRLGPLRNMRVPAGFVEYLSLTPEQRLADYRARVEKAVRDNPNDAAAQLRYFQLLLDAGDLAGAAAAARRIGHNVGVTIDLALAILHAEGPERAGAELDRIPLSERGSDYFLARAQILDAAGKREEAATAVDRALEGKLERPDSYRLGVFFLTRAGRGADALRLLDRAPESREILLLRAVLSPELQKQLKELQSRWPEWPAVWIARGVMLKDAQAFETAAVLGARSRPQSLIELLSKPLWFW